MGKNSFGMALTIISSFFVLVGCILHSNIPVFSVDHSARARSHSPGIRQRNHLLHHTTVG